jgi:hypothetical protein
VSRALLLVLAGAWLGALVLSWAVASATFRTAEAVAALPPGGGAGEHVARVPAETRRPLFRHIASEVNRWMFGAFGWAQLAVAIVVAALAWPLGGAPRWLAVAALVIVAVQGGFFGPRILELGRAIDFVPRPLPPDVGRRFGMLHGGYVVLDLAKAVLVITLAFVVARRAG